MKKHLRLTTIVLVFLILLGNFNFISNANQVLSENKELPENSTSYLKYSSYSSKLEGYNYNDKVVIDDSNIVKFNNAQKSGNINNSGKSGIIISDNGSAEWKFNVPKDSVYKIAIEYAAAEEGSGDLELGFLLDGKLPFDEVKTISLNRLFEQPAGEFKKNSSGNEIKPDVLELLSVNTEYIKDISGYISEPFDFLFLSGEHTITLSGVRGKISIFSIMLLPKDDTISYEEYSKKNDKKIPSSQNSIVLEGEHFNYKNSVVITPKTDRTSPITSPQSAISSLLNTVGGNNWKSVGDYVVWNFNVEEDGLYRITIRARQNVLDGMYTCRRLYIDDKVPFKEVEALRFKYNGDWQTVTFGNGETCYEFYLTKGQHSLKLEAIAGDLSENIASIRDVVNELYRIYRRITMITGSSPDTQRDYYFNDLIPNEIKQLGEYADILQSNVDVIDKESGAKGSYTSVLKKLIAQLNIMSSNSRTIAKNLEQFKSNLASMSSWLLTAMEQPLEIDLIEIAPSNTRTTIKDKAGIFKTISFLFKNFLISYVSDYTTIGGGDASSKEIEVWIQTGRDQAEVIRELIDSNYSENYNNSVKLSVVTGALLQSVLAGQAPDVVFDSSVTDPMEYALRGAVYNLNEFEDFEDVAKRFSPAALKAATFENGVYGLPQTYSFFMFFYRTDIFEEYGLGVPETWDELIAMIPTLQRNSMEFGMPHDLNMYTTLLYQRGYELYRDNGAESNLDTNGAISTFVDFTDYFSLYDLSVTYDFSNRFRSGEMPCAIADFITYNQLTAFAPEIKGRWEMVPIPATLTNSGELDNTSIGTASYIMLLENSKVKEESWEFMKWFMSEEIQSIYGIKMESILGSCAKVATANLNALSKMTWSSKEYNNLFKQYNNVDSVPQVPGGYYLTRIFNFAFNRTYNGSTLQNMGEDPSNVLSEYIPQLNEELKRKRAEFGR